jgi:hypothetical protein
MLSALLAAVMLAPLALFAQPQPARSGTMASGDGSMGRSTLSDSITHHHLSRATSIVSPRLAVPGLGAQYSPGEMSIMRVPALAITADSVPFEPRSASTAFILSFLVAGGGQLYAGETKKGVVLMALELAGAGLVIQELATCDELLTGGCDDTKMGVGAVLALGSWIVSLIDAPSAARRYNEKHTRAQAIVDVEPGRVARLGARVALGR